MESMITRIVLKWVFREEEFIVYPYKNSIGRMMKITPLSRFHFHCWNTDAVYYLYLNRQFTAQIYPQGFWRLVRGSKTIISCYAGKFLVCVSWLSNYLNLPKMSFCHDGKTLEIMMKFDNPCINKKSYDSKPLYL